MLEKTVGFDEPSVGLGYAPDGSSTVLSICQVEVELPTTETPMFIGPMQCQLVCFRSKSSELAREYDCSEATMWRVLQ